jgi:dihydrofolate synthase / folylpolyglutamate synthase
VDFRQALQDLDSRQPESMPGPSLDRIRELANLLDHPELTYPSIHVTGTNGKTTTTRMIAGLACACGLSAGAFTSPHVREVTERFSVCGVEMTEGEFGEEYERLQLYFDQVGFLGRSVTYFERLTAMAYLWFADKPVGLGVFEVGMGGTWDATNLIRGEVAVLCPIGLDHKELGSTVAEVAREKAGIIKESRVAVVREQRSEALAVIRSRCADVGATLFLEGEAFALVSRAQAVRGQALSIRGLHAAYDDVFLPLFGEQLARNAVVAVVSVEALLGRPLGEKATKRALATVTSPGRIEIVARRPAVLLDGAHNPDAATALVAALSEAFRWGSLHLVMGMFADKDIEAVTAILASVATRAYACLSSSPRAAPPERVGEALRAAGVADVAEFSSVAAAVGAALDAAGKEDLILVTGSFYTVADARPMFVGA